MTTSNNLGQRLRIAQVCRVGWPHIGGMERVVASLSAALVERGHAVVAFTLDRSTSDGSALPAGILDGVPYRRLARIGPRCYPLARGLLGAVSGFDVIHVHGVDGLADQLVAGRRVHGARVGISTHGGFFHTGRLRVVKQAWMRTVSRFTLRHADAVWFTSEADRVVFEAAGITGSVLPDGVDVQRFERIERRPEPGLWVVIGRVDAHKGIDDLIATLGRYRAFAPRPFRVFVIGPDRVHGLSERLRDLARRAGVAGFVTFRGEVDDDELRDWLSRAELALFPSRYEGFGVGVVEAMAAGVPVVVSAIPAFDALVRPGTDGFRIDFREPERAARELAALRGALDPVGAAGRAAAARHRWSERVREYEAAYRSIMNRRSVAA